MARQFTARDDTIKRELSSVANVMEVTGLKVNQDLLSGAAEIVFDRGGKRYAFRCSNYVHPSDNLRAAQLTIKRLYRAYEVFKVESSVGGLDMFDTIFLGFEAVPNDGAFLLGDGRESCWEVLGIEENASREAIRNALRSLSRLYHPDVTGEDGREFRRIREAYDEAIRSKND